MLFRNTTFTAALLVSLTAVAIAKAESPERSLTNRATAATMRPASVGTEMPVVAEHYYRMLAKVRPLLFWMSRDNVGGARIGWLGDHNGSKGFELLIGSDPARAPRKINRWGYIAEEVRGANALTLGVMKQSNEQSIEEAKAKLDDAGGSTHAFKAIRATTSNGQSTSDVLTLQAGSDLTYRDIGSVLMLVDAQSSAMATRTVNVPAGTRPGFLLALSDLMANRSLKSVPYVYNGRFHRLHLKSSEPASMHVNGRDFTKLVRARFETESQATHERTPFEITYGTTGNLRDVPVHVMYQPKWWFQVELFLEDDASKF